MDTKKMVLVVAAVGEAATGVALMTAPSLVGRLLFGSDLAGIASTVARVTGIALVALGIACWPGTPLIGMLTYGALATLYLAYFGFTEAVAGMMLWPAVALLAILTAGLVWASREARPSLSR